MLTMNNVEEKIIVRGRFAPSPSGELHAGNIFSSLMAWLIAKTQDGSIVLRIEDLDPQRSKTKFADRIMKDYEELGLFWDEGPFYQNDSTPYETAFNQLELLELTFPCFCTRADLKAASAPHQGDSVVYPGTCRNLSKEALSTLLASKRHAWRVRINDSIANFYDEIQGEQEVNIYDECGDFIVRRSDGVFAYNLAVVVDDTRQGINSVVRGCDLLCVTPQQYYLQEVLNYEHPTYAHVPLFVDQKGRRLSKRNKDAELNALLARLKSPEQIIGEIAAIAGLIDEAMPITPEELLSAFEYNDIINCLKNKTHIVWTCE